MSVFTKYFLDTDGRPGSVSMESRPMKKDWNSEKDCYGESVVLMICMLSLMLGGAMVCGSAAAEELFITVSRSETR